MTSTTVLLVKVREAAGRVSAVGAQVGALSVEDAALFLAGISRATLLANYERWGLHKVQVSENRIGFRVDELQRLLDSRTIYTDKDERRLNDGRRRENKRVPAGKPVADGEKDHDEPARR